MAPVLHHDEAAVLSAVELAVGFGYQGSQAILDMPVKAKVARFQC